VKLEQASKVKSWKPTRQSIGEGSIETGRTDESTETIPPGYEARHVEKAVRVIEGDPRRMKWRLQRCLTGNGPLGKSERVIRLRKPGNAGGGKGPHFECALEEAR
jgi:hypothetical protein